MTDTNMASNITRDKVILGLEKLKVNVSLVEAQYQVLGHDFSGLCDEILTDIKTLREEESGIIEDNSAERLVKENIIPIYSAKVSETEAVSNGESIVTTNLIKDSVFPVDVSSQPAVAEKLVAASVPVNAPESSEIIYQSSIHDIITNYTNHHKQDNYQAASGQIADKNIIDKIADGIETGLDRLGDGLMYPVVKLVSLIQNFLKPK
jgi:hypothetical protein